MSRWSRSCGVALSLMVFAGSCGDGDGEGGEPATGSEDKETEQVELQDYRSRPDLTPPVIDVTTSGSPATGYVFVTPARAGAQPGPLIVDDQGETVWAAPLDGDHEAKDFRVQTYRGEPVLTWWEGETNEGHGFGELVLADTSYREIARVGAGDGLEADFHELRLTDEGTAFLGAYQVEPADLTGVGGPERGYALENYVQEVDVATGEVLMQWRASDHVPFADSYSELGEEADAAGSNDDPYDWFHVNSVAPGPDGTLLVSARNTHAVYAIDRATGELRWQLGGKDSDISIAEGAEFSWQHDAQWIGDGRMSLFDNHGSTEDPDESRALILDVDVPAGTAALAEEARHPDALEAGTQGNTQALADGNMLVGWGSEGFVTEFGPHGEVVFDATFAPATSYRAYRFEWTGQPTTPPDVVARRVGDNQVEVVVSWNGATEVAQWRVLGGDDADDLTSIATVNKDGFETSTTVDDTELVSVEALDAAGQVLGASGPVEVTD